MSPIIYYYFQIFLEFYSNEKKEEGPHVHAVSNDGERGIKALFDMEKPGVPISKWIGITGKEKLKGKELKMAKKLIEKMKPEILKKWIDFRFGKKIKAETITRKIK